MEFPDDIKRPPQLGGNTTIAVIAVNALVNAAQAKRIAIMAQDGLARSLRPVHTPFDGDAVFVIATGERPLPEPAMAHLGLIGSIAADCLARAVGRAVFEAEALGPWPSYRASHPKGFGAR
jgi:L-aminopeptidase/D-esterase-like protein